MSEHTRSAQRLRPGVGLGPLRFGDSREVVAAALGQPSAIEDEAIPGWLLWDYPELGCELAFDREEDNRLVSIRCDDSDLVIEGRRAIGLDRDSVFAFGRRFEWGPSEIETGVADDAEDEEIDFPDAGLMFSLRSGHVVAVSAAALVDDADHYDWP